MNSKDKDLLKLGKMLRDFSEMGVVSRKELLWVSFLRGLAQGFGAIVGGTILVALFIWMFTFFDEVPLIGPITRTVNRTIQSSK